MVRGGEGGRCLQQQPKGVSGVRAEGSQTNQCWINLSPIANAARVAPAGRFGLLARPVPGIFLAWPGGRALPGRVEGGGRLVGEFKRNTASVTCSILSHTHPSYFFCMKIFTRNLISDHGSKFHARIYFTKHVIFRGRKMFN